MCFYFDHLGRARVYLVIGESVYTEKYSGEIIDGFYYPEKRKLLSPPFNRIEIINDKFVFSYDTPEQKAWIDWVSLKVHFGHRVYTLKEDINGAGKSKAKKI